MNSTPYGKHKSFHFQKLTHSQFKNRVKFESYLSDIKNRKYRVTFTKFRLSDHGQMIEKGRHKRPKIPREQRFCPFCPTKVEDEIHFLTECIFYKNRNELLRAIETEVAHYINLSKQAQFTFLMSQENKNINDIVTSKLPEWFTKRLEHADAK